MSFELAVIVSTFERPEHLRRCLASLEVQEGVAGRFEVVVVDDGSRDGTASLVAALARRALFPLRFTTHRHEGFRLARCRNAGVAASTAPYLLFTDGDCLLPPDHLRVHLEERRPGGLVAGACLKLDRAASEQVDVAAVRSGAYRQLVSPREVRRIRWKARRAKVSEWLRLPMKPLISGHDISLWRRDLERVNGFDECFVGWGLEDRDLQRRLQGIGVRVHSIMGRSNPVHLWHPPAPSFVRKNAGTANLRYSQRREVPSFCREGLVKSAGVEDTTACTAASRSS